MSKIKEKKDAPKLTPNQVFSVLVSDDFDRWYKNNLSEHLDAGSSFKPSKEKILADIDKMFISQSRKRRTKH